QRGKNVFARELLAHVQHVAAHGAGADGALADLRELAALAQVERDGDDFRVVLLFQPRDRHRRVEPTRVRENNTHVYFSSFYFSRAPPAPASCPLELARFRLALGAISQRLAYLVSR